MAVLDRFDLTGRTAVVTGSTRGLGRAFARALAEAGANVVIMGRDAAAAASADEELRGLGVQTLVVLADLTVRADIERHGLTNFGRIPSWDVVRVAISPNQPQDAGRTLGEIARRRRVDALDAVCDFLLADRGATRILITSMSEQDVQEITGTPWVTVGSDANALATSGVTSQGKPHPRSYGTHARLLGPFVREHRLLSLPAAIHKTTGAAAAALGLGDRGVLREGSWADVTVFDPARIADRATYDDPHQYAVGVSSVLVNGEVVVDGGDHTGVLPGRVLRRRS